MAPDAESPADDEPQAWVQWDDGTWSPAYADGWTGEPVSLAEVLAAVTHGGPSGSSVDMKKAPHLRDR